MQQSVSGGQLQVNISRAVSRLKTFFFSFYGGDPAPGMIEYDGLNADATNANVANSERSLAFAVKEESNFFYHPMLGSYQFNKG